MSLLIIRANSLMLMFISAVCTVSVQVASEKSCRWNQLTILRAKVVECLACPECPDGEGLVPQCGSRVTADVQVQCVQCKTGESYSNRHDISSCKPCTICDPNEETISPCTSTKNAVCGKCNAGYYRAVTGDCHPCSWCCSDSKDEDIEKQCSEQPSLPANQICRYDVNTIKCAPAKENSTAHAMLVPTSGSKDGMATQRREGNSASTLWLIAVVSCLAFAFCVLLGVMSACCYRKQMLSQFSCSGLGGCVTAYPTQVVCNEPPYPQVVTGNEPSKEPITRV